MALKIPDSSLLKMAPAQLQEHYRDVINCFNEDFITRCWTQFHYVQNDYHAIVNEKIKQFPFLHNNKNGMIEFVFYVGIGAITGGTTAKVAVHTLAYKFCVSQDTKKGVENLAMGIGAIGGGMYGAYKFADKIEKLPEYTQWKSDTLTGAITQFINSRYENDSFLKDHICPITFLTLQDPVKMFGTHYEYSQLIKIKNTNGMIMDPKRNGIIHEKNLIRNPFLKLAIEKRIVHLSKEDLINYMGNDKLEFALNKIINCYTDKMETTYEDCTTFMEKEFLEDMRQSKDRVGAKDRFRQRRDNFHEEFGFLPEDPANWTLLVNRNF